MKRIFPYPGAKWALAKRIVDSFPESKCYLEPFCGSAAVLLNMDRRRVETINDLNSGITNLFSVIRDNPDELAYQIALTPYSKELFILSHNESEEDSALTRAVKFLIRSWQGHSSKEYRATSWRFRSCSGGGNFATAWSKLPEDIALCAERLCGVQIENMDALELIAKHNNKDVLIYADPPYPWSTRTDRKYRHEMSDDEHIPLLDALITHKGPVVISGYRCDVYDTMLDGWSASEIVVNAEQHTTRTEVLWSNL